MTPEEKSALKERIIAASKEDPESGCWIWQGSLTRGYAKLSVGKLTRRGNRVSYEVFKGELKPNSVIHHKCGTKLCVNPAHLQQTTHSQNLAEMLERTALTARIAELEHTVEVLMTWPPDEDFVDE